MSVQLHLTTEQSKLFKQVVKTAKIKGVVYFNGKPELDKSNFEKVVDAVQNARYKLLLVDERSPDLENLRVIAERLDKLWVFFEVMPEVKVSDETPTEEDITETINEESSDNVE